jgi:hypothetical protein
MRSCTSCGSSCWRPMYCSRMLFSIKVGSSILR